MTTESILLVDDNPTNLQMLFQLLEKGVGCKLLVAKNGETALTIARKTQPDLILLDIMMPGIDGFEVCRRLKADPVMSPIPVIFLSALDETADKVLDFINTNLCKVNKESFVTAIYAVYDSTRRALRIARAGHPLPVLFRPAEGNAREVPCDGVFPMGYAPYEQVPVTDIRLEAGDRVLLYTDGVSERFNMEKMPYGEDRICRQMERPGVDGPAAIVSGIMQDLETFSGGRPADDDQALLLAFIE